MPINEKKLARWASVAVQLGKLKTEEASLRKELFDEGFPEPAVGTNYIDLANDYRLKGIHKLSYKVDEQALSATLEQLPEHVAAMLIKYKPDLVLSAYKALSDEDKCTMGEALTIKPGMPTLEIVAPKAAD